MVQQQEPDMFRDEQAGDRLGGSSPESRLPPPTACVGGQGNPDHKKDAEARKRLNKEKRERERKKRERTKGKKKAAK